MDKKSSETIYSTLETHNTKISIKVKELELTCNTTIQEKVQQKFKSQSYLMLSKDLREACGQCGFNITQNGNQKFQYKNSGLVVRNILSCQWYTLYKGTTKEISDSREFIIYTLHNDWLNQKDQGRKKCRRSYSSKFVTRGNWCRFFFYIKYDTYGFYVEPGLGYRKNPHHFKETIKTKE